MKRNPLLIGLLSGALLLNALSAAAAETASSARSHNPIAIYPGSAEVAGQFVVDSMQALKVALLAGAGAGAVPTYSVVDDIKEGKLVQLFPEHPLQTTNVFVMYRPVDSSTRR